MLESFYPLVGVVLAGLVNVIGGYAATSTKIAKVVSTNDVLAAVAGFLLAAAFLGLIPEAAADNAGLAGIALGGYLIIYLAENIFPAHLHGKERANESEIAAAHDPNWDASLPLAASWGAVVGLTLHAFFDGIALVASFQAGLGTGMLLFLAISLHKLPVGFGLVSMIRASHQPSRTAVLAAWLLFFATTVGGLAAFTIGELNPTAEPVLLALSAGVIIYIGATDMIPLTHRGGSRRSLLFSLGGVGLFYLSWQLLQNFGLS